MYPADVHATNCRAIQVMPAIPFQDTNVTPRFPSIESILGMGYKISDCWVTVHVGHSAPQCYHISTQNHLDLPVNLMLKSMFENEIPSLKWHGDVVIMKGGARKLIVNLTSILRDHAHLALLWVMNHV